QREALDCHAFTSNRREECAQMPGKIARSAPRPPFGLPDALVAVLTSRLSCRKAGKARIFTPDREFIWGIPGLNGGSDAGLSTSPDSHCRWRQCRDHR